MCYSGYKMLTRDRYRNCMSLDLPNCIEPKTKNPWILVYNHIHLFTYSSAVYPYVSNLSYSPIPFQFFLLAYTASFIYIYKQINEWKAILRSSCSESHFRESKSSSEYAVPMASDVKVTRTTRKTKILKSPNPYFFKNF